MCQGTDYRYDSTPHGDVEYRSIGADKPGQEPGFLRPLLQQPCDRHPEIQSFFLTLGVKGVIRINTGAFQQFAQSHCLETLAVVIGENQLVIDAEPVVANFTNRFQ